MSRTEGPLRFDVSIQVHAHPDGSFTLRALGPAPLVAWSTDPESVREDLELALIDRIERTHPSLLHRFQTPRGREVVRVEVGSALKLAGEEDQSSRSLDVDALVEPDLAHLRVRLPAFDASLWIGQDDDLRAAVRELVERMLEGATLPVRLERQSGSGLSLQVLPLEVEPASLEAFTGEHAGSMLLPEPVPAKTEEEKEREKRVPTPTLDRLGMEWTEHRDALVGAWGREGEVAELLRMLERPGAAVVVVGPPLAGKSAVIEQAVKVLEGRRAWFLDASRLVHAGSMAGWRGQTLAAVHELGEAEGLWLIGDPLPLLDAGKHVGSDMNVSQVLKPFLSNGQLRVLGECSEAAWGRLEAKDAGFARLFTPWRLTPPAEPRPILEKLAATLPVPVASDGVDAAMELAVRYGPRDARLGTAAHFLRRLAAEARALGLPGPLDRTDVLRRFCAETGLPEILVRDDLPLDPESVRQAFASALVGQDDAVERLVDLVAVIKGGMSDLDRPLGSFLFVGPTGVGKTEAAKALARWLFGGRGADDPRTPARLVRFDMSELSGPDCVARLLDPSAGLVAAVRRRPFSVVLLDEIEKAHPAVFDLLLQVLGEARLSDANGTVADFRNTVVLLTSNLGIGTFRRPTGFGGDPGAALQQHVLAEVERFFRPELFNRIDQVVPFASLGADAIGHIAHREVAGVARRPGLRTRGVALEVDPAAVAWLA
ncbi:MAG: ATP-dependent Clp protease ATP-binding subunit, partial [Myxococcales bacterium]|nr:ATP-dependent Clp protease ATP-binding subunit [Myxococcales bacterium]